MSDRADRGRFEGVLKIIRFNTRFYVGGVLGLVLVVPLLAFLPLPAWLKAAGWAGAALMLFWSLSSLAVSWYVYDHTGVMRWEWMRPQLHPAPQRWVNIHAGLDESTASLRHLLPRSDGVVVDIYDPEIMTEPSIARARQLYPATEPFQVGRAGAVPLPDGDRDAAFLLFAAHELRDGQGRTQLLREVHRALTIDGQIFLVEHLRDLPNLLAFGPGFLHFHAARQWQRNIADAGFEVTAQRRITPFVRCYTLRKVDA